MRIEDINIRELLPQQDPFVMVDQLTHFDETTTQTLFTVRRDNLFVENGLLDNCILMEIIAQTCAARLGYVNKYILKRPIQIGFIGAVRDMIVYETPRVGDTLRTTIQVVQEVLGLTLVDATVMNGNATIAQARMKIALREDENWEE